MKIECRKKLRYFEITTELTQCFLHSNRQLLCDVITKQLSLNDMSP